MFSFVCLLTGLHVILCATLLTLCPQIMSVCMNKYSIYTVYFQPSTVCTGSISRSRPVVFPPPELIKLNWTSHSTLCWMYSLSPRVTGAVLGHGPSRHVRHGFSHHYQAHASRVRFILGRGHLLPRPFQLIIHCSFDTNLELLPGWRFILWTVGYDTVQSW